MHQSKLEEDTRDQPQARENWKMLTIGKRGKTRERVVSSLMAVATTSLL